MARHFPAAHQMRDDFDDWENEGDPLPEPSQLQELGITRTLVESFSVGRYRYTKLEDAMAQANRQRVLTAKTTA